jgi:hypothetical protein
LARSIIRRSMYQVGYWVDIANIQLDDTSDVSWIQALPLGKYDHPVYGEIDITPERVLRMAANVNAKVRGQDLDIDYDHKDKDGKAAGWVKQATVKDDGLWLAVQWTDPARTAIKQKEYRYFSPEFADEWEHPKSKQKHMDVLFGGALTNRPFLKDILPINLSDITKGTQRVTDEEIRTLFGLTTDAPITDQMRTVATQVQQPPPPPAAPPNPPAPGTPPGPPAPVPGAGATPPAPPAPPAPVAPPIAASEVALKQLAESNPAVALLLQEREDNRKRLADLEQARRLAEVNTQIAKLNEGAKFAIPPATLESVQKILLAAPTEVGTMVYDFAKGIATTGLDELGERGSTNGPQHRETDESKQFTEKVNAFQKEQKCDYAQAVVAVSALEPELAEAYRNSSYMTARGGNA